MRLEPVAYASLQRLFGMIGLRVALVGMMLVALLSANAGTALAQDDYGCTGGQAVPNPENNSGLVADCETLLGLKDALRGTAPLDWNADFAVPTWEGVTVTTVDGVARVTSISLTDRQLSGTLPAALSYLDYLETLDLAWNELSGTIPAELGNLAELQHLNLGQNQLTHWNNSSRSRQPSRPANAATVGQSAQRQHPHRIGWSHQSAVVEFALEPALWEHSSRAG